MEKPAMHKQGGQGNLIRLDAKDPTMRFPSPTADALTFGGSGSVGHGSEGHPEINSAREDHADFPVSG
jgi:hypothetical protein